MFWFPSGTTGQIRSESACPSEGDECSKATPTVYCVSPLLGLKFGPWHVRKMPVNDFGHSVAFRTCKYWT